jgi:hypothetical protein
MRYVPIMIVAVLAACPALAADDHHQHGHKSPYAGEQTRGIKALSDEDVEELLRGGGWGLAKAAELNGMPGPTHVLDMAADLGLSAEQTEKVRHVRDEMRRAAVALGERFVAREAELEASFSKGVVTEGELTSKVTEIEATRAELRIAHLRAHLAVDQVLTDDQIERYNMLRGYR